MALGPLIASWKKSEKNWTNHGNENSTQKELKTEKGEIIKKDVAKWQNSSEIFILGVIMRHGNTDDFLLSKWKDNFKMILLIIL